MIDYWRLELKQSDDFILIFQEDIPLSIHRRVRGYHQEFRRAIAGYKIYPFNEADTVLYHQFRYYYEAIGKLINLSAGDIDPESRHRFFVCTEPADGTVGLSGLEQLMGYSQVVEDQETDISESGVPTTSDPVLDILTDIYLTFKSGASNLVQNYSIEQLCAIANCANEKLRVANESIERQANPDNGISLPYQQTPNPEPTSTQVDQEYLKTLRKKGIQMPDF